MDDYFSESQLEIEYGYFVYSKELYGIFKTEAEAFKYAHYRFSQEEIEVLRLPYLEYKEEVYPLWNKNACKIIEKGY